MTSTSSLFHIEEEYANEIPTPLHFILYASIFMTIQSVTVATVYCLVYSLIRPLVCICFLCNIIPLQIIYCEVLEYPRFGVLGKYKIPLLTIATLSSDIIYILLFYNTWYLLMSILVLSIIGFISSIHKSLICNRIGVTDIQLQHVAHGTHMYIVYTLLSHGILMTLASIILYVVTCKPMKTLIHIGTDDTDKLAV